jgi:hypothetical protein
MDLSHIPNLHFVLIYVDDEENICLQASTSLEPIVGDIFSSHYETTIRRHLGHSQKQISTGKLDRMSLETQ